jgi:hypothetical protein
MAESTRPAAHGWTVSSRRRKCGASRHHRPQGQPGVADADEYRTSLKAKLREEVQEFLDSDDDPEDLADILEVLHALAEHGGTDRQ